MGLKWNLDETSSIDRDLRGEKSKKKRPAYREI